MSDSIEKTLGDAIREFRLSHYYGKVEQLAAELGVTRKTINNWETGKNDPPAKALMKLYELGMNKIDDPDGADSYADVTDIVTDETLAMFFIDLIYDCSIPDEKRRVARDQLIGLIKRR